MAGEQKALVLQGGGALGAYEAGACAALVGKGLAPEVVTGVSIGAINAVTLAAPRSGDAAASLRELWRKFSNPDWPYFPNFIEKYTHSLSVNGLYRPHVNLLSVEAHTSYADLSPLRRTLETFVDFDALNSGKTPRVVLTAVDVSTGRLARFDCGAPRFRLTPDHVLASAAFAPSFPAAQINGASYWDGALADCAPLSAAIEALDPDPAIERRIYLVDLFPLRWKHPIRNVLDVKDRLIGLTFANRLEEETRSTRRINDLLGLVDRLAEALDEESRARFSDEIAGVRRYRRVSEFVRVPPPSDDIAAGAWNFLSSSIERRFHAGQAAAEHIM